MIDIYKKYVVPLLFFMACIITAHAQTQVSGTVKDTNGDPVPGANIIVKGTTNGTMSNENGAFTLTVNNIPPFTLQVSYLQRITELEIDGSSPTSGLEITIDNSETLLSGITVTGISKIKESALTAPMTVEAVDLKSIQQTASPDYFDMLQHVKGVQFTSSSLNFPQINTRGFATIANVRFVQMVDWMDISAPLLNFPTGNIVGLSELDAESMELIPGASSALYGPNAFNGVLLMTSKSPFDYQGISAQAKAGITTSDAQGESFPTYTFNVRYAKAFNDKFAFKVNFAYMKAEDWYGNDYKTDVNRPANGADLTGQPNFDGLNLYGDDTQILIPIGGTFGTLDVRRTGWKEEDILDNRDAASIKGDVALHYKINDKVEALYNYRYGGGSSVYQGSQKYALRDFTQQFHKLELRADNFFVRGYMTATDAGDSYNLGALGGVMNERISPTASVWAPTYAQTYVLAMQGYVPGVPAGNQTAAHQVARQQADAGRPTVGSAEFNSVLNDVRNSYFQKNPSGAKFEDQSRLYHGEFMYNFMNQIQWVNIQVGGNIRQYSLFSNGTIFNEDPDGDGKYDRIDINEYGFYTQLAKSFAEKLKLTASLRYDKNENFDSRLTPRISAVIYLDEAKMHNIRGSFQTGFRNPDTQAQFIYFPVGTNTLLGSTKANAERYGLHEGGAYTTQSVAEFRADGGVLNADGTLGGTGDPGLLVTANIPYVGPERLKSYEIGYKGLFQNKILVDFNYYYSIYNDFIGGDDYVLKSPTTHRNNPVPAGTVYSPYVNLPNEVTSQGIGIGLTYSVGKGYTFSGNYNWATFDNGTEGSSTEFRAGFNTPENKYSVSFSNPSINGKSFGFNVSYRYQDGFLWQSDFGSWEVPKYGALDAMVSYNITSMKTLLKVGGSNLFGGDYRTNFGGPYVGQQYYISLTFDQFTAKR